jgi:hypothetical protein
MRSSQISLTTNWSSWCEWVGPDWVCRTGNLLSAEEIQSRTPVDSQELVETIITRLAGLNKSQPAISAVFNDPDFLPFRFLELGIKRGAAVCRLVQKVSPETAKYLVENLDKREQTSVAGRKLTASALSEILLLDEKQKLDFFGVDEDNILSTLDLSTLDKDKFAKKISELPCVIVGTGFLVGRSYLLTNYHVFLKRASDNSEESIDIDTNIIKEYIAQFSYEQDIFGREIKPIEYQIQELIASDRDLDYALVKIEEQPVDINNYSEYVGEAGDHFGWIPMLDEPLIAPSLTEHQSFERFKESGFEKFKLSEEALNNEILRLQQDRSELIQKFLDNSKNFDMDGEDARNITLERVKKILKERAKYGEPVNIIQHPKGRYKEVVVSNNWTLLLFDNYISYDADADFSSSGSPVFNQQWQLVALHHGSLPASRSQEGIRICRIVESLRDKLNELPPNLELQNFVRQFLARKEEHAPAEVIIEEPLPNMVKQEPPLTAY